MSMEIDKTYSVNGDAIGGTVNVTKQIFYLAEFAKHSIGCIKLSVDEIEKMHAELGTVLELLREGGCAHE